MRTWLIAGAALALAASSGYLASVALSQTGAPPTRTVTVDVGTGPQGEPGPAGPAGPPGPQGEPGPPDPQATSRASPASRPASCGSTIRGGQVRHLRLHRRRVG